uniref:hypothetical protein n=1 Tax=Ensifer aridi TaxID=1708715 RepID=UPI001AED05CD
MEDALNGTGGAKTPPRNPAQDKAWSKAHPTIRRLAYGVLILGRRHWSRQIDHNGGHYAHAPG